MRSRDWGLSQHERYAAALDPAAAPLDERPLAHFLRFVQGYAELLNFHEADGVRGNWRALLDSDVSFLLAEMCDDNPRPGFEIGQLMRRVKWDASGEPDLLRRLYEGLRRIDGWHQRARQIAAVQGCTLAAQLALGLERIIQQALRPLREAVEQPDQKQEHWRARWQAWHQADRQRGQEVGDRLLEGV